jgi:hypothetical protein
MKTCAQDRRLPCLLTTLVAVGCYATPAQAQSVAEFYTGK